MFDGRGFEPEPGQASHHLHGHETQTQENLRPRARVAGSLNYGLDAAVEYAINAVRLCQQGRVYETQWHPQPQSLEGAEYLGRFGQHGERRPVREDDPQQQEVTQLPAGRHDHGGLVEHQEDDEHRERAERAEHRERGRQDEPEAVWSEIELRQLDAHGLVDAGARTLGAGPALELVLQVLAVAARNAHPAAGGHVVLGLADIARLAAHGFGRLSVAALPKHGTGVDG